MALPSKHCDNFIFKLTVLKKNKLWSDLVIDKQIFVRIIFAARKHDKNRIHQNKTTQHFC